MDNKEAIKKLQARRKANGYYPWMYETLLELYEKEMEDVIQKYNDFHDNFHSCSFCGKMIYVGTNIYQDVENHKKFCTGRKDSQTK